MVFSSVMFVYVFFPCVFIFYILLNLIFIKHQGVKTRHLLNIFLLAASMIFYAWGEPENILILIFCSIANYYIGKFLVSQSLKSNKFFLALGVGVNLGLLIYYKYAMLIFSGDTLSFINSIIPDSMYIQNGLSIALPLGISFYIFQSISYLVDVYRIDVEPADNYIDFACYLTMFPQLVAGPIVRYKQIAKELHTRKMNTGMISSGIVRFILGLAKKVLVADTLGKVADAAFAIPSGELPADAAWIGIICYSFQIYYDFSGYSDMAIGMGKIFGFSFPENFNYPYIARSIQEYWTRWHMSLSTWFKDYLYIPLGGNRRSPLRTYFNLFIVFLLCGLWHGANWTFLAWGAYYGVFLVIERAFPSFIPKLPRVLRHIYVLLVVIFGWVVFKAETFAQAIDYYKSMFGVFDSKIGDIAVNLDWSGHDVDVVLVIATLFSMPVVRWGEGYLADKREGMSLGLLLFGRFIHYVVILAIFAIMFMPIFGASYKAFIYFRF